MTVGLGEGESDLGLGARGRRGIGNPPVRGHRLARPDRADLTGRVVTDREDEIERRGARLGELVPGLGPQICCRIAQLFEQGDGVRIDRALGSRAGRKGLKPTRASAV